MNVARDHVVVVRWNLRKEVFVFSLEFSFYRKCFAHFLSAPVAACVAGLQLVKMYLMLLFCVGRSVYG